MIVTILWILFTLVFLLHWWDNTHPVRREYHLPGPSMRLGHLTDFHQNPLVDTKKLCRKLAEENLDLLLLTGDYVEGPEESYEILHHFLQELTTLSIPIFAIWGNHDQAGNLPGLRHIFQEAGIRVLENETVSWKGLELEGLLHHEPVFQGPRERSYSILLCHDPGKAEEYYGKGPSLILSGHTHGGQVRLPLLGALVGPDRKLFPRFTRGLRKFPGGYHVVDSGLGNARIDLRIFNPISYTVIQLEEL